jgi:MFS family permease
MGAVRGGRVQVSDGSGRTKSLAAPYASGLFSMGQAELLTFIVPLWAVLQGASPAEIGLLVGAKSMLTFLLAIHGGALMDRLGTRRVMLFFTGLTGLLAALYPFLPWLPLMVVMQMMIGFASNMTWIGAQTIIAQTTGGDPAKIGKFSFFARIGNVAAPVLMGLLWDFAGPTLSFFGVSCWSACMFLVVSRIENPQAAHTLVARVTWRDILPKLSDYTGSLKLALIPAVAFTLAISFTRHATNAAENSFLIVYLRELGFAGAQIGAMFSLAEILNGVGSLLVGRFITRFPLHWTMILFTAFSIVLLALTPFLGGLFVLLAGAQCLRRMSEGLVQPLMFSLQAKAAPRNLQGAIVGLRVTNNRLASILTPIVMGLIVQAFGLTWGFLAVGGLLLAGCCALAFVVARADMSTPADKAP